MIVGSWEEIAGYWEKVTAEKNDALNRPETRRTTSLRAFDMNGRCRNVFPFFLLLFFFFFFASREKEGGSYLSDRSGEEGGRRERDDFYGNSCTLLFLGIGRPCKQESLVVVAERGLLFSW